MPFFNVHILDSERKPESSAKVTSRNTWGEHGKSVKEVSQ